MGQLIVWGGGIAVIIGGNFFYQDELILEDKASAETSINFTYGPSSSQIITRDLVWGYRGSLSGSKVSLADKAGAIVFEKAAIEQDVLPESTINMNDTLVCFIEN